jgi:hypothetical protein
MKITKVTVRLGKTVPNALREFSNLRADVELSATPGKGSTSDQTYSALRAKVEALLDRTLAGMRAEEEAIYLKQVKAMWVERGVAGGDGPCLVQGCGCLEAKEAAEPEMKCRVCGCTESSPCVDPADGSTCGWADEEATLCTFCAARQGEQPPF